MGRVEKWEGGSWQSRDFLRQKLAGKRVSVSVDYVREMPNPITGDKDRRPFVTIVTADGENVGVMMAREGMAEVMKGGRGDDPRASAWDEMVVAEAEAQANKKGLYNPQQFPDIVIQDLTRVGEKKGRQFLTFFQKGASRGNPPRHRAIIDAVMSPVRFRLHIPKEGTMITFALAGVGAPSMKRNQKEATADPFAREAEAFCVDRFNQREVEVEVHDVTFYENSGSYQGVMYLGRENVAISLLEAGFAHLRPNADKLGNAFPMKNAERKAKEAQIGIWSSEDAFPQQRQRKDRSRGGQDKLEPALTDLGQVMVTDIVDPTSVYVQVVTENSRNQMKRITQLLKTCDPSQSGKYNPQVGQTIVAQFPTSVGGDGQNYRAKVLQVFPGGKVQVFYMDYGNAETIHADSTMPAPTDPCMQLPPLASKYSLAYLRPQDIESAGETDSEATNQLRVYVQSSPLSGKVVYKDAHNTAYIDLLPPQGQGKSAQEELVSNGLGRPDKRLQGHPEYGRVYDRMKRLEAVAKRDHLNMWAHGDISSGDEY